MTIANMHIIGEDTRARRYLLPKAVLRTWDDVRDAQTLLQQKPLQIGLNEPAVARLDNTAGGQNAALLLDFGVEFHGSLRLMSSWLEGRTAQVRLCFGESASEALSTIGVHNATNDHSPRDFIAPVCMLSDNEYAQTGYRFVYIELLTPGVVLQLKAALGVLIYRDIPYLGSFACSDERLNRIYETAVYTCHMNMQTMLWDGIKRDRLVWIGDMHPEMLTIRSVFGADPTIGEGLTFVRDQTPLPGWMCGIPSYSLWWLIILYDWYLYTGEETFLAQHKQYALQLIQQILACVHADGSDTLPSYFLDWPTSETPAARDGVRALLARALDAAARLADLYGQPAQAQLCRTRAQAVRAVPGRCHGAKQTAAFMLLEGIPDADGALPATLLGGGAKGMSTFMSYYILSAMHNCGTMTQALAVLKTYYGGMLDMGATTFWEDFDIDWLPGACPIDRIPEPGERDIHADNGAFCYKGLRHSLCHGWASGPVGFLSERVLGIQVVEAGCKTLRIQPDLGDLQWARGAFPTPLGLVQVEHMTQADGTIQTKVDAPPGIAILKS